MLKLISLSVFLLCYLMQVNGNNIRVARQADHTTPLEYNENALLQRIVSAAQRPLAEQAYVVVTSYISLPMFY